MTDRLIDANDCKTETKMATNKRRIYDRKLDVLCQICQEGRDASQVLVIVIESNAIVQYNKINSHQTIWRRSKYPFYIYLYINTALVPTNLHIVYILHARQLYRRSKRSIPKYLGTFGKLFLLQCCKSSVLVRQERKAKSSRGLLLCSLCTQDHNLEQNHVFL